MQAITAGYCYIFLLLGHYSRTKERKGSVLCTQILMLSCIYHVQCLYFIYIDNTLLSIWAGPHGAIFIIVCKQLIAGRPCLHLFDRIQSPSSYRSSISFNVLLFLNFDLLIITFVIFFEIPIFYLMPLCHIWEGNFFFYVVINQSLIFNNMCYI